VSTVMPADGHAVNTAAVTRPISSTIRLMYRKQVINRPTQCHASGWLRSSRRIVPVHTAYI